MYPSPSLPLFAQTATRTPASTPSITASRRPAAVAFPASSGFLVSMIGLGVEPVTNTSQVTVPVAIRSYLPCGAGCSSATLERTIAIPSSNTLPLTLALPGAMRDRAVTCNAGTGSAGSYRATYRGCKLKRECR